MRLVFDLLCEHPSARVKQEDAPDARPICVAWRRHERSCGARDEPFWRRQRTSIARALYNAKDIVLFDDLLSAVDFQVGSFIFGM